MTEPAAPPERKKKQRKITCPTCGHEWTSYGYGVRIACPECYRQKTGKSYGPGKEKMAELRAKRKCEQQPAPQPQLTPKKGKSLLGELADLLFGG